MKNIKLCRLLAMILCLAICLTAAPVTALASPAPAVLYGDADGNGVVNLQDVLVIEKYAAGEANTYINLQNADVNLDGKATVTDSEAIREYLIGNRDTLTPEPVTITFNSAGGDEVAPMTVAKNFPITAQLPTPAKEDAVFVCWEESGSAFDTAQTVTGDLELTAAYEEVTKPEELFIDSFTLEDIDPDHEFIITGADTADEALSDLTLTPKDGSDPLALEVEAVSGGWSVKAVGGFRPGGAYEMTLAHGLCFDGKDETFRTVTFSVHKDEKDDLEYNPDLIFIQDTTEMVYTVDGEAGTKDVLQSMLAVNGGDNDTPITGSFTMSDGELNVGDFACIYQTVDPRDRDYTDETKDYSDDAIAYIKITGETSDGYEFSGITGDEVTNILFIPDTIPYTVTDLDSLPETVETSDYDAAAWDFLGTADAPTALSLAAAPEFDVNDFLVFYEGEFTDLTDESACVYAQIISISGTEITYEVVTKDYIESFSGMYVEQPLDGEEIIESIDQKTLLASVERQALESGFADEAAASIMLSALDSGEVEKQLLAAGYTEEEILLVANDIILAAQQSRDVGTGGTGTGGTGTGGTGIGGTGIGGTGTGGTGTGGTGTGGTGTSGAPTVPKMEAIKTVEVGVPEVTARVLNPDETRWGQGVGVALDVHIELQVNKPNADKTVINSIVFDL